VAPQRWFRAETDEMGHDHPGGKAVDGGIGGFWQKATIVRPEKALFPLSGVLLGLSGCDVQ